MSATPTVMNTLLVKSHTLFLPELSESQLVEDGRHALEEMASHATFQDYQMLRSAKSRGRPEFRRAFRPNKA